MSRHAALPLLLAMLVAPGLAVAQTDCPPAVRDAAQKAYPNSRMYRCKREMEKGKLQYEVRLATKEETRVGLDISPEGAVLLTAEGVDVSAVPKKVMAAFAAKYPQRKAERAERQTKPDGAESYEIAFKDAEGKKREATFKADGTFVEEE